MKIAKGLEHDGILTGAGKATWWASTVKSMLKNEKYMGDALLQKTHTVDFLTKKRVNMLFPGKCSAKTVARSLEEHLGAPEKISRACRDRLFACEWKTPSTGRERGMTQTQ